MSVSRVSMVPYTHSTLQYLVLRGWNCYHISMNTVCLIDKNCKPCEGGVPPLTPDEIQKMMSELKKPWTVKDNTSISYTFIFKNFKESMAFVQKVADLAEQEGHHPDIYIFYNKVTLTLWTHAINGLSENDFIIAGKAELLV